MAAIWQASMFFASDVTAEGWREAFVKETDNLSIVEAGIAQYVNDRTPFLSFQARIDGWKAARIDGVKLSKVIQYSVPRPGEDGKFNEVSDAVMYRGRTAAGSSREFAFRAVPDAWIEGGKLTAVGTANLAKIDNLMNNLINITGASLRVPPLPYVPIETIANEADAPKNILITTAADHGLNTNDVVMVKGLRGYPYVNGRWLVNRVDAKKFTLQRSYRYVVDLAVSTGSFRKLTVGAPTMSTFNFGGVGTRQTGVPFFQRRGKRSKKVLHR